VKCIRDGDDIMPRNAAILLTLLFAPCTHAADPTYWQDVRPLLRKHCTVCHSGKHIDEPDISAGLALDTPAAIRKGGKSPVVAPKKGTDSLLVTIMREKNLRRRMPLDSDPLADTDIAIFQRWIDAGMPEGTPPTTIDPIVTAGPPKTRKRDVILPTKAVLPKTLAVAGKMAPLELVAPIGPLPPVTAVAYSPDGKLLASGSYGAVVVWDLTTAKPAKWLTNVLGSVNDLKFSPDGKLLAVAGGQPSARGDLRLYQTHDWKLLPPLGGHTDVVSSIAFTGDGKKLASASFDKTVRVWDVAERKLLGTSTVHSDFVYAVAFDPKGEFFVSASKDRTCRVIDVATMKSRLTLSGMDQDILAVAVSSDGQRIVSSGFEASLYWWDAQTGAQVKRGGGYGNATHELAFIGDGSVVVSAGADNNVRLWDPKTQAAIRAFPAPSVPYAVAIRSDGKQIAAGCFDGQLRIWEVATARPLAQFLAVPGANASMDWLALTPEGFADGSQEMIKQSQWRLAGQKWAGKPLWSVFQKSDEVQKSLRAEKMGEPSY